MRAVSAAITLAVLFALAAPSFADKEGWEGVDRAVIEKAAEEKGRPAVETPLNSLDGDSLLFVFLLGGAAGGFAAGYFYRKLTERSSADE